MPTVILTIASLLGSALGKLAMSLVSEEVVKKLVMFAMRQLVKSTENTWDDELLAIAEEKWNQGK